MKISDNIFNKIKNYNAISYAFDMMLHTDVTIFPDKNKSDLKYRKVGWLSVHYDIFGNEIKIK